MTSRVGLYESFLLTTNYTVESLSQLFFLRICQFVCGWDTGSLSRKHLCEFSSFMYTVVFLDMSL